MPMSFMTGSIVGGRFYKKVTTREADDGNGWNVMLDYRTLKTPSKRPLQCPTLALAKAIAAEWEFQQIDGIRPFTMPLMKLTCTALERVPLTRPKIIEHLTKKIPSRPVGNKEARVGSISWSSEKVFSLEQDVPPEWTEKEQAFFLLPHLLERELSRLKRQVEKLDPLLNWVESEFDFKPIVYSSFFGGKQEEGLVEAIENLLKKTDDCELAAIDAIASSAHSLVIALGIFRGRLDIEQAIELIRLEEDLQVDRWGLVEGGHDVDIADLRVQVSAATVFLGLSRKH
ncbi:ATP12 protein-related [Abeliophyllum distichum]|uniref:ATP12 protein-related n=1 Tax=Abeliophyllum distichum TaxID=126358 RepID=A0ABD1SXX8_9LAMI